MLAKQRGIGKLDVVAKRIAPRNSAFKPQCCKHWRNSAW